MIRVLSISGGKDSAAMWAWAKRTGLAPRIDRGMLAAAGSGSSVPDERDLRGVRPAIVGVRDGKVVLVSRDRLRDLDVDDLEWLRLEISAALNGD